MHPASSPAASRGQQRFTSWVFADAMNLLLLLLLAAALRLYFFNGFFGSDDLVYLNRSLQIAGGIWTSADYNGALRYGYNIPAALFIYLFGLNPFTANAWTLFCSLSEIGLVYFFAARYLDRRVAVIAALILAFMPLHMALGTRIHADSVLALFLTLTFVLFYVAEQSASRALYFAAGLAMGMVFWVKELGVITYLALATYPLFVRRLDIDWLWVAAGGLVMLGLHLVFMYFLAGDPLHLIRTVTGQVQSSFIEAQRGEDAAGYYFKYLFLDIRHTWLVSFFAVLALAGLVPRWRSVDKAPRYLAWWLISLLVVLSFTPVSLDPLRLVMKQSNYLNLFFAPLALLGGFFLANFPRRQYVYILIGMTMLGGFLLGALQQQSYHVFTANSRAAVAFLQAHPGEWMLGSSNNANMARIIATLESDEGLGERFGYLALDIEENLLRAPAVGRSPAGYAVLDQETMNWGRRNMALDAAPSCWQPVMPVEPELGGPGHLILRSAISLAGRLPGSAADRVVAKLHGYMQPRPATIYRVEISNLWCGDEQQHSD